MLMNLIDYLTNSVVYEFYLLNKIPLLT